MSFYVDALRKLTPMPQSGYRVLDLDAVEFVVSGYVGDNVFINKGHQRTMVDRETFLEEFREVPLFWLVSNTGVGMPIYIGDTLYYDDGAPAVVVNLNSDMDIVVRSEKYGLCTEDQTHLFIAPPTTNEFVQRKLHEMDVLREKIKTNEFTISPAEYYCLVGDLQCAKRNATTNSSKFMIGDILTHFSDGYVTGMYPYHFDLIQQLIVDQQQTNMGYDINDLITKEAIAAIDLIIRVFDDNVTEATPVMPESTCDQEVESLRKRVDYLESLVEKLTNQHAETVLSTRIAEKFPLGVVFYIDVCGGIDSEKLSDTTYDHEYLCDSRFAFGSYDDAVLFLERIDV